MSVRRSFFARKGFVMDMNAKKDRVTPAVSLGKSMQVRGYTIKRLPLGRYLEMLEMLRETPEMLIKACFPGQSAAQVLAQLKRIDASMLSEIMMRAMTAAPAEAVRLLAYCTGIDEKTLLEDENIGLDGAMEMAEACYEINQLGNFMQAAGRLAAKAKKSLTRTDGSRG